MVGVRWGYLARQIKLYFINKCHQYNRSPPKIAAGLWYLSFISLDLLVDGLDKIDCLFNDD